MSDHSDQDLTAADGTRFRDPMEMAREGITAARVGDYENAYRLLGAVCDRLRAGGSKLPAPVVSYYGLCVARCEERYREASEYCRAVIEVEPFKADYYANLAEVYMLGRRRRKAVTTLQRGLALDAENERLLRLRDTLGVRRRPVIPFLDRANPVNVGLGRLRHTLSQSPTGSRAARPR